MTTFLLLTGFILIIAGGLALFLRLWKKAPSATDLTPEQDSLSSGSALATYQPMNRLFAEEDFAFLSAQGPAGLRLEKRLRQQRRHVLRLYLRELKAEFQRVYAICRLLAAHSQDPNFASLITRQMLEFYGLWAILQIRCSLGWFLHVRVDTTDLVSAFDGLREVARASLTASPIQAAAAGGAA